MDCYDDTVAWTPRSPVNVDRYNMTKTHILVYTLHYRQPQYAAGEVLVQTVRSHREGGVINRTEETRKKKSIVTSRYSLAPF